MPITHDKLKSVNWPAIYDGQRVQSSSKNNNFAANAFERGSNWCVQEYEIEGKNINRDLLSFPTAEKWAKI